MSDNTAIIHTTRKMWLISLLHGCTAQQALHHIELVPEDNLMGDWQAKAVRDSISKAAAITPPDAPVPPIVVLNHLRADHDYDNQSLQAYWLDITAPADTRAYWAQDTAQLGKELRELAYRERIKEAFTLADSFEAMTVDDITELVANRIQQARKAYMETIGINYVSKEGLYSVA